LEYDETYGLKYVYFHSFQRDELQIDRSLEKFQKDALRECKVTQGHRPSPHGVLIQSREKIGKKMMHKNLRILSNTQKFLLAGP